MNFGQKIIIGVTLLLLGNTTFANGTYHYHGERGHSHPLPATGIAHRHGDGIVGTATKPSNTNTSTPATSAHSVIDTATRPSLDSSDTMVELESVEERQCEFKGGSWSVAERSCKYTYSDAGKVCTDSSDCQGRICVAPQKNPRLTQGVCPQDNLQRISASCRNGYLLQGKWQAKNC